MEMLLMALCVSMFGLAVAAIAFGAATNTKPSTSAVQPELRPVKAVAPSKFFNDQVLPPLAQHPHLPNAALLAQIEDHVRLEQAAAESFLESPSHKQLHTKTTSAFVN
jgi:hypothetical protein